MTPRSLHLPLAINGGKSTAKPNSQLCAATLRPLSRKRIQHRYGRACRSVFPTVADLSNCNDGRSRRSCLEYRIAQLVLTMSNGEFCGPHARHYHSKSHSSGPHGPAEVVPRAHKIIVSPTRIVGIPEHDTVPT